MITFNACKFEQNTKEILTTNDTTNLKEKIIDSEFKNINLIAQINSYESKKISPYWIIKTSKTEGIKSELQKTEEGLKIKTQFLNYGYLYIRQIIRNIYQFENKTIVLKVKYDNEIPSNLRYDIYIQSRFISDNTTRILVTDTETEYFKVGNEQVIEKRFKIPNFKSNYHLDLDTTEGLSVAFRLINDKEEISEILIKQISIEIEE